MQKSGLVADLVGVLDDTVGGRADNRARIAHHRAGRKQGRSKYGTKKSK